MAYVMKKNKHVKLNSMYLCTYLSLLIMVGWVGGWCVMTQLVEDPCTNTTKRADILAKK